MLLVHAPKTEAVHDLPKSVVIVEELDRAHDIEDNFRVLTHEQCMDGTWDFNDIVTWLAFP